jgi:hypothetical protein
VQQARTGRCQQVMKTVLQPGERPLDADAPNRQRRTGLL